MSRSVSTGAEDFTLHGVFDLGSVRGERVEFPDALFARGFLAQFEPHPSSLAVLRELAAELERGLDLSALEDDEVLGLLARRLTEKSLRIVRQPRVVVSGAGGEAAEPEQAPGPEPVLASITYQLVDDATGDPIPDIALLVTLPDGKEQEKRTDAEGTVKFERLRPGRCSVRAERGEADLLHVLVFDGFGLQPIRRAPPAGSIEPWERPTMETLERKLVRAPKKERPLGLTAVRPHRVRTGETLASIAERYELDEKVLTKFNFGSTERADVQRLLAREVGCRRMNLESGDWVLSDQDRPGLLYVPVPFRAEWQVTDNDYVLRVHRVLPAPRPYVFSV